MVMTSNEQSLAIETPESIKTTPKIYKLSEVLAFLLAKYGSDFEPFRPFPGPPLGQNENGDKKVPYPCEEWPMIFGHIRPYSLFGLFGGYFGVLWGPKILSL